MNNPAPIDHPVHDLIQRRWSPRAFAERTVEPEALASVLEAARWAPSSYNEQPWRFIVAGRDDPETYQRLLDVLVPANQDWARTAPVLMLSVAAMAFERNGKPNPHAFHDVGLASGLLALQATAQGLAVHFMAGFDANKARETFAIPDGFEPVAAIALGYHANAAMLSGDGLASELASRTRKPVDAFTDTRQWGFDGGYSASSMA